MVAVEKGHFDINNEIYENAYFIDHDYIRGKQHGEPLVPVFKKNGQETLIFIHIDYFEFIEY